MEKYDFIFFTLLFSSVPETDDPIAVGYAAVIAQPAKREKT
ncbi:MAG: hypothetical protein PUC59_07685 [Firmicutes bacterium]|nr:hypothetical protein [Bacillota bacterium]